MDTRTVESGHTQRPAYVFIFFHRSRIFGQVFSRPELHRIHENRYNCLLVVPNAPNYQIHMALMQGTHSRHKSYIARNAAAPYIQNIQAI